MKVKYLGTLFAASVLSLGLVTSCATPEAGETEIDTDTGIEQPDTDAEIVDPCAGELDGELDIETEELNPCAGE